jgi:hypothetical protein
MVDGDSESVVQRSRVMNVEHDELVGAGCFQQLGDIPGCDRIFANPALSFSAKKRAAVSSTSR